MLISARMFLRNFLLFSQVNASWRYNISHRLSRRFRRFNKSLYFKCGDDVEKGLKQQYIQSKTTTFNNNNENETKSKLEENGGSSNNSVYFRRGLKTVSSLLVISLASFIAYTHMDNLLYGIISIFIALVTVLFITGKWRWFYIATVTTPRDTK